MVHMVKVKNHTLPKKKLKVRIYQGEYRKLWVGQAILHSNPSSKSNSYATVTSIYVTLTGQISYI